MKRLASLVLVLVLSLSLAVPALADGHGLEITTTDGELIQDMDKGDGWTYVDNVLTLNGVKDMEISIGDSPTIVLAPGSKNTITRLWGGDLDYVNDITIKGTGELIIYSPVPYDFGAEYGAFAGLITSLKLEDGLKMTGGLTEGESGPVSIQAVHTDPVNGFKTYSSCTADKKPAMYVRIAPAEVSIAPVEPSVTGFTDVANSSPYAEAIKWAVDQKITTGITATTFGPGNTCTVSHILTFLWRANGRPNESGTERESVAAWADGLGIDTTSLGGSCTRAAAVTYMWKAAGSPEPSKTASFTDVPAGMSYAKAVSWAVEKGITAGTSATEFSPDRACTRGQIVTFLYRASNSIQSLPEPKSPLGIEKQTQLVTPPTSQTQAPAQPQTPSNNQSKNSGGNSGSYSRSNWPKGKFLGSIESDKYHSGNCRAAKKILPENERWFNSESEAKSAGYSRCGICW